MTTEQLEKLVLASVESLHRAEWTPPPTPPPDMVTPEILGALKVIDSTLRAKGFGLRVSTGSVPLGLKEPVIGFLGLTVRTQAELTAAMDTSRVLNSRLFPGGVAKLTSVLDVGLSLVDVLQGVGQLPWSFEGGMVDEQKRIEPPFDHPFSPLESLFVAFEEVFARAAGNVARKGFEGFKKNEACGGRAGQERYWNLRLVYGDSPLVCA